MVEVEQRTRLVDFLDDAGVASAVGRGEVEQVAGRVLGALLAVLLEQRSGHALQQRGIALAERLAGRELEARRLAFAQPEEASFERLGELA